MCKKTNKKTIELSNNYNITMTYFFLRGIFPSLTSRRLGRRIFLFEQPISKEFSRYIRGKSKQYHNYKFKDASTNVIMSNFVIKSLPLGSKCKV